MSSDKKLREDVYHINAKETIVYNKYDYVIRDGFRNLTKLAYLKKLFRSQNLDDNLDDIYFNMSVRSDHLSLVKLFAGRGANVNPRNGLPLSNAVALDDYKLVKYLLSKEASVAISDGRGTSQMSRAIRVNNFKMVKLLLANEPNILQPKYTDILQLTVSIGSKRLFKFFVNYDHNTNVVKGIPPIIEREKNNLLGGFSYSKDVDLFKYVMSLRNWSDSKDKLTQVLLKEVKYGTPNRYLDFDPHLEFIKVLVEYGANINYNNGEIIKQVIAGGHLYEVYTNYKPRFFENLVTYDPYQILDYFISKGANLNPSGLRPLVFGYETPLVVAVWRNSPKLVKYLLDNGAQATAYENAAIKAATSNVYKYDKITESKLYADATDILNMLRSYSNQA
jgi:hypothetical protein